jgi:hypothetical protein
VPFTFEPLGNDTGPRSRQSPSVARPGVLRLVDEPRAHSAQEPHDRPLENPRRVLRRLPAWLHRRRRHGARIYTDRYHVPKKASYVYQRLYVSIVSASRPFIEWIGTTIYRLRGLRGGIHLKARRDRPRPVWVLRYAKKASVRLLRWMYYAPDVVCLARKRAKADPFIRGEKQGILGRRAGVSELVDDTDSKSVARKGVGVRVPSPAPPSLTMPPAGR